MHEVSALGAVFIFYKTIPLENGRQSLKNGHGACPCWVRCLPQVGNVLAPVGHDLYPFLDI